MDAILELLKSVDQRLATLETLISKPRMAEIVCKESYGCSEVAKLTQTHGVKAYRPFTVRLACKDRRIPEAEKRDDGSWVVPRTVVLRILEYGMPPERRSENS